MTTPNDTHLGIHPDAERTVRLAQRPRQSYGAPRPPQWRPPQTGGWAPTQQPFQQYGNGYPRAGWPPVPPAPTAPTARRNLLIVAAVTVAGVIALLVTVVVTAGSGGTGNGAAPSTPTASTTTAKPKPVVKPIPPAALSRLMLTGGELSEVVGTAMTPGVMWDSLSDPKLVDDSCISVALPASTSLYGGSGYTGVQVQSAESAAKDPRTNQSVIAFPTDEAAADFVKNTAQPAWEKCANRTVNYQTTDPKNPMSVFWNIGAVTQTDGLLTVTRTQEGSTSGWECHQGLVARRNVVMDFYVCGRSIAPSVITSFADEFGTKVDKQK